MGPEGGNNVVPRRQFLTLAVAQRWAAGERPWSRETRAGEFGGEGSHAAADSLWLSRSKQVDRE